MSMGASAPIRRSFDRALFAILCLGLLLVLILVALLPWQGPYWAVLLLFPINVLVYLGAGLLASVDAAIDGLPSPQKEAARIEWEYATEVQRSSGLVPMMGAALGLDGAALDTLFIEAEGL